MWHSIAQYAKDLSGMNALDEYRDEPGAFIPGPVYVVPINCYPGRHHNVVALPDDLKNRLDEFGSATGTGPKKRFHKRGC